MQPKQLWKIPASMRLLLRSACRIREAIAPFARKNASNDFALHGRTWPGHSVGVRAPDPFETPLSLAEVGFAVRKGLL